MQGHGILTENFKIKKIFILGAGFSAPAGLPLTNDILSLVHEVSSKKPWYGEKDYQYPNGQADWLLEELQFYYPVDNITHHKIKTKELSKQIDIENFISYVAVESALTGDKWSEHGNKFITFLKCWLAEVIYTKQKEALEHIPDFYIEFLKVLKNSLVITFNWDTLLENICDHYNTKYSLNRKNWRTKTPIIKLHGSIDWFSKPSEVSYRPWMSLKCVGDNLKKFYKADGDLNRYYNFIKAPHIVIPSYDKINQISILGTLWESPWYLLQDETEIIIIGLSMREDDYHIRAFIYPQLVQGSRDGYLRIKVIDKAENDNDCRRIKKKYRGIKNVEYYLGGFNSEAIQFIKK